MKIKINKKYPLEVIFSTCSWFLDNYYVSVDSKTGSFEISFDSKKGKKMTDKVKNDFLEKLEEFNLYFNVDKKNQKLRKYIVGQALFPVMDTPDLAEQEIDKQEVKEDPMEIAVPWEEKFKK